jgi:hypothetical protein
VKTSATAGKRNTHVSPGSHTNALLEAASSVIAGVLARRGFSLAGPVTTKFETAPNGSCGVGVQVMLEDPREAPAAAAAIHEHLGDDGVDVITVS